MTDRNKAKRKTEFGADKEADRVLEALPRNKRFRGLNAYVFIDATGALQIYMDGGGALTLREQDLRYVHGDELA